MFCSGRGKAPLAAPGCVEATAAPPPLSPLFLPRRLISVARARVPPSPTPAVLHLPASGRYARLTSPPAPHAHSPTRQTFDSRAYGGAGLMPSPLRGPHRVYSLRFLCTLTPPYQILKVALSEPNSWPAECFCWNLPTPTPPIPHGPQADLATKKLVFGIK